MSIGAIAAVIAAIGGLLALLLSGKKKQGAAEANVTAQQKIDSAAVVQADKEVKQVEQVNAIQDKLASDPAYAERVRDRFQRD
jgi:hypothetical protein